MSVFVDTMRPWTHENLFIRFQPRIVRTVRQFGLLPRVADDGRWGWVQPYTETPVCVLDSERGLLSPAGEPIHQHSFVRGWDDYYGAAVSMAVHAIQALATQYAALYGIEFGGSGGWGRSSAEEYAQYHSVIYGALPGWAGRAVDWLNQAPDGAYRPLGDAVAVPLKWTPKT